MTPFRFRTYRGETLRDALVTLKIDGVRAHATPQGVLSRAGKPLHNILLPPGVTVAEVFCGSWEATVSAVRTQNGTPVDRHHIYPLCPDVDLRLLVGRWSCIDSADVRSLFEQYHPRYEGLVIQADGCHYKVKGEETHDVPVTGVVPGNGKHAGRMGALMTPKGKVGTGFTDAEREQVWMPGMVIEVACMELTPGGVFRHPRFVRRRYDKE